MFWLIPAEVLAQDENGSKESKKLSQAHQSLTGIKNCSKCHIKNGKITPAKCLSCHRELAQRIGRKSGYHGDKQNDCSDCHSEHGEPGDGIIPWEIDDFDHNETGFSLTGAHRKIRDCRRCHNPGNAAAAKKKDSFLLKSSLCSNCHRDVHLGYYPQCTECHQTRDWQVDIW